MTVLYDPRFRLGFLKNLPRQYGLRIFCTELRKEKQKQTNH